MPQDASPKTIHDIASTLMAPTSDDALTEQSGEVVDDNEQLSEDTNDQEFPLDEGNDETSTDDMLDDEEGDDEDATEDDDDAGEPADYLDINDDDLIEVKIDGEWVTRSIADAKKALSGEGAYDKRVKEATELRTRAESEHAQMVEKLEMAQKQFTSVVQQLEKGLFTPQLQKPDQRLRQSNPQAYNQQLADYEYEQEQLQEGRKVLHSLINKNRELVIQQRDDYRKEQAAKLVKEMPVLNDPKKAPQMLENMLETARSYGFSDEEINAQLDHRYYLMVADLMKLKTPRTKGNTASASTNAKSAERKRPRKLRSGATKLKARASAKAKQQAKTTDRARSTGKVKDVAATLIRSQRQ